MAAANKSHLTDAHFGYDIVVATTQAAINATMKKYLSNLAGRVEYIIAVDDPDHQNATKIVPWDDFLKLSKGSDPFKIPSGTTKESSQDLKNIDDAKFVAGIKITLGMPGNFDVERLTSLPDILNLKDGVSSVEYKMMCQNIEIAQLIYNRRGTTWSVIKQNDKPNRAWTATSHVNLKLDRQEFKDLPQDVKDKVKNLDDNMFGVQQLFVDVDTAVLSDPPKFDESLESDSDAMALLLKYFSLKYFSSQKEAKRPVLGYTVVHKEQTATLKPTDLNFHISPLHQSNPSLMTLDYLCSTAGKPLPPATDFSWDWVSAEDAKQIHGVVVINRNTFAKYLYDIIYKQAIANVFKPWVHNELKGLDVWYYVEAQYNNTDTSKMTVEWSDSDPSVLFKLKYYDGADDEAGAGGGLGALHMHNSYNCTVRVSGNKIYADSEFIVHLFVRALQNRNEADVYKKTCNDVFELSVDEHGQFKSVHTPNDKEEKGTDSTNAFSNFFANVNDVFDTLKEISSVGNRFKGTEIGALDNFIFPGGTTFAFKGFRFSDYQDLLCDITYVDPQEIK